MQRPGIDPLVGQRIAAAMPQHTLAWHYPTSPAPPNAAQPPSTNSVVPLTKAAQSDDR
jgi:hypothetical protein